MADKRFPTALADAENLNTSWRDARLLTKHILKEKLTASRFKFTARSKIATDLGSDSLDLVEIAIALEKITGVRVNERVAFNYVLEIVDYLHFIRTWEK